MMPYLPRAKSSPYRWRLALAVFAVPLLWALALTLHPHQGVEAVDVGLLLVSGLALGMGRQGIDLLVVRLVAASALLMAVEQVLMRGNCQGLLTCYQEFVFGLGIGGAYLTVVFGVIAVPVTVAWNRGTAGLGPELRWRRLAGVAAWQWALLAVAIVVVMGSLAIGVPVP